jgi:hypothetical protein
MSIPYKKILPEYPSIRHLPWKPNSKGDKIATEQEAAVIFSVTKLCVQEKIDGANCGMAFIDGYPVVRNRTKILRKGQEMKNPSLKQFASAWNWMHDRKERFDKLDTLGPYSVYGEWMIQQHGMVYDTLPEWFIAYDVYDYEKQHFIDPWKADSILRDCGFSVLSIEQHPAFYFTDDLKTPDFANNLLEYFANKPSRFAVDAKREGIIVKVSDGEWITDRFKMVRQGFEQGCLLESEIKRNKLIVP